MAPASRLAAGGGMLSVTAPAHPAAGAPAVGVPAAGPGTEACPILIARTSGRSVAWRICQTPVSCSAHAPHHSDGGALALGEGEGHFFDREQGDDVEGEEL